MADFTEKAGFLPGTTYSDGFDSISAGLDIGWLNDSGVDRHFDGVIDELAVHAHVLTPATIKRHFNDGRVGLRLGYLSCGADIKVMPLGDSITEGAGSLSTGGYRGPLLNRLVSTGYEVSFVGRRADAISAHEGWGSIAPSGFLSRVPDALITNPPNILLLHVGTNQEPSFPDTVHVEAILDQISSFDPDITVVLARIINRATYNPLATQFNQNLQAMADARIAGGSRIVVVDMESALLYSSDMADDLHPNLSGHTKMSDVWFEGLHSFLPACYPVAPAVTSSPETEVTVGESYVHDIETYGYPYATYTLISGPSGMSIHPDTGRITWTPSAAGAFDVTVQVENVAGTDTLSFTLNSRSPGYGNIAPLAAEVSASSEDLAWEEEAFKAVDGVVDGWPNDATREWATLGEGVGAWLQLDWLGSYTIDRVVLYDRPNSADHITAAQLQFSDGTVIDVGALDNAGAAKEVLFAPVVASSLRVVVTGVAAGTFSTGLAEVEVYSAWAESAKHY